MTSPVRFRAAPAGAEVAPSEHDDIPFPTPKRAVACGLCGHRFVPDTETMACARCPMARGCAVICCPRCGYEFVTESRLVNLLRRLFAR